MRRIYVLYKGLGSVSQTRKLGKQDVDQSKYEREMAGVVGFEPTVHATKKRSPA